MALSGWSVGRFVSAMAIAAMLMANEAAAQPFHWGAGNPYVAPATGGLISQVTQVAGQVPAGFGISVTSSGGVTFVNGMQLYGLYVPPETTPDFNFLALSPVHPPGAIAIDLDAITTLDDGEVDEWDIAALTGIVTHEEGHDIFAKHILAVCSGDPFLCIGILNCHREFGQGKQHCNEFYASSRSARLMCEALSSEITGILRSAIEAQIQQALDQCCKEKDLCAQANAVCPPEPMPMPPDHQGCTSCPACAECSNPPCAGGS